MLTHAGQSGITLLELVIGMVIIAALFAIGMPSFSEWSRNTAIRAAAESIHGGLLLARNEAVRRNRDVRFSFTSAQRRVEWTVGCTSVATDCPANIQSISTAEGRAIAQVYGFERSTVFSSYALADGDAMPNGVTFNGFGLVSIPPSQGDLARIDIVAAPEAGHTRRLLITIGSAGAIRLCDPAIEGAADSRACPPLRAPAAS